MNTVPIVFAFDNNLVLPACVCISSLLTSAHEDTFYDIFILHPQNDPLKKDLLDCIPKYYSNCKMQYRVVDDTFDKAFEIRGITKVAYFRLLIPDLIPEYEKIVYSDVDIVFRMDLANLYNLNIDSYYLAATRDIGLNFGKKGVQYITSLEGVRVGNYLQSGFIMMNCRKIRQDKLTTTFCDLAKREFKYQDQDILNIACRENVLFLPIKYNMTDTSYYYLYKEREVVAHLFNENELQDALMNGNIHYNGHKPWKKFSVNFDIWWDFYRKSPFFDEQFYFDFYWARLNEYDQLSLWKRIKILIRYFVYGKRNL